MAKTRPPMEIEVACPHCGGFFHWQPHGAQKARSPEQHKRFFLAITLGYRNLPPETRLKFVSAEHYRAMVIMKCGPEWREVAGRIPVPDQISPQEGMFLARGVMRASIAGGLYYHPQLEGKEIVIYRAKSVSWLKMGHREFNFLNTLSQEVIEADVGRSVDAMIKEHFDAKAAEKGIRAGRERAPKYIDREF